ncbi:MAG: alpha/beta hydrolase [Myxococcales bacterium]|nr:alpha/beta hydrolase [Myxococcales bacterium]
MESAAEPIYRGMDQETLDREYDLRTVVPDHESWAAKRTLWSDRARATLECRLDVRYGSSGRQAMDIFPATGPVAPPDAGAPVEIYIHGGGWRTKSKEDVSFMAEAFVPAGVTFVAIDHDLAPDVALDQIVGQVRAAVAWVHRNIAGFGGDPDRIHVSGHSSGAHLAAMILATPWGAAFGLPDDLVKASCLTSGLFDLEPVRLGMRSNVLNLDEAAVERLSPIHHIPTVAGPLILSVGGHETAEFVRQTDAYRIAWLAAGHQVTVVDMPSDHHYSLAVEPGKPDSPLFKAVLADIRRTGSTGGSRA